MRTTLRTAARLEGTGLHTGTRCSLELRPSRESAGIRFFRTDIKDSVPVAARLENVRSTVRGTNLSGGGCEVFTVEHVLSALAAFEVDDADIFMAGPEPPALDGSAIGFVRALETAGTAQYDAACVEPFAVKNPVEYRDGQAYYRAEPAGRLEYSCTFISPHPLVSRQEFSLVFAREAYIKEIAPARTFGFEEEIEALRKAGLAKGGSLENAVIITKTGFLAKDGLRFPDEAVRHKLLDMIGDFMLAGKRLERMKISATCGGHAHNVKFARQLLQSI